MNTIVQAALERITAALPAGEPPNEGELGYGRDLDCLTDCTDDFAEVDPLSPRAIAQAVGRRFQTPRGTMRDDTDYGFDLRGLLHKGITPQSIRQMQTQAEGEAEKDERVERAEVTMTFADNRLTAACHIVPRDPRVAPFTTVYRVTAQTVTIEA